ncbi:MAG: hypothetical protein WC422_03795 [Candidatus Paceibacterota bacterium]
MQFILKVANDEEKRQEYINIKIKECDEKIKEISNYDSETHAILSADIKSFYDYYNKIKEDDKLYEQFLDSPFISHINLDNKIYYISKVKSQIENNLIL